MVIDMVKLLTVLISFSILQAGKTTLSLIDDAYREGRISKSQWLEYQKLAVVEPDRLPKDFKGEPEPCGTQIILNYLRERGQILAARPSLSGPEQTIGTTHFKIHYTLTGGDATSTNYANNVANYFEYSWSIEVDSLGWDAPPPDNGAGGDDRYDIYIINLSYGVLGYTSPEGSGPDPNQEDRISYIAVDNNIGSTSLLRNTCAHEFNHACQFSYSGSEDAWWMENCATWMENVVYDNDNEYIDYLVYSNPNPLNNPRYGISTTDDLYEYAGAIWPMFLSEFYGSVDVPRQMWERMGSHIGGYTLYDIDYILSNNYGSDLATALKNYALWRYFTGSRADAYHFEEASLWPTAHLLRYHNNYPASGDQGNYPLHSRGGTAYVDFNPGSGLLMVNFDGQDYYPSSWAALLVGYRDGGPSDVLEMTLDATHANGSDSLDFDGYDHITLIPVVQRWNIYSTNLGFSYTADVTHGDITLYPNPLEVYNTDQGEFFVRNDGNGPLNVTNIYTAQASWIVDINPTSFQVPPGDSQSVIFSMDTTGLDTINYGWIIVESDDPDEPSLILQVILHLTPNQYVCGDMNGDGLITIDDISYFGSYLYLEGPPPVSMWAADVNGDGSVSMGDLIYLANFLFFNGPSPNCPPQTSEN